MLHEAIRRTEEYQKLRVAAQSGGRVALFGLPPAVRSLIVSALTSELARPAVVVTADEASATRFAADAKFFGSRSGVLPSRDFAFHSTHTQSNEYEHRRLQVLGDIVGGRCNILCSSAEGLLQLTLPRKEFTDATLTIKEGTAIKQTVLIEKLLAAGYHRRDRVDGAGQFSVRGGIIDIYAPDMKRPARIEFWGDTVDTLSGFDVMSQRREIQLKKIYITPAREVLFADPDKATELILEATKNITDKKIRLAFEAASEQDLNLLNAGTLPSAMDKYLTIRYTNPETALDYFVNPIIFLQDAEAVKEACRGVSFRSNEEITTLLTDKILSPNITTFYRDYLWLISRANETFTIAAENFVRGLSDFKPTEIINLPAHALPPWAGDIKSLIEDLQGYIYRGYFCAVAAGTARAATAIAKDLSLAGISAVAVKGDPIPKAGTVAVLSGNLTAGGDFPFAKFVVITSRVQNTESNKKSRKKAKGLTSLEDIKIGDHLVHQNHGIGIYAGIERVDLQGVVKDYLKIKYAGADVLFVAVTQLDGISRYTPPGDEEKVKLAKLGGEQWHKTKSRVRAATEDMAKELVELYAKRKIAKGFACGEDTEWQRDFEARFEYEETEDQLKSADEIKKDMERPYPMDRLLCGDVGVGKTEVALRGAFKAVMAGKQVAVLVPTTILAWQHYNTILRRMESFPVKVAMMSRFCTPKQMRDGLRGCREGTVDIVIGTHRLLQPDIKFKDLGLIIIDEEQRFGVKHKEKLKTTFTGVDVLTLSATPIPRTLNMAMSGIRDMSTIEQPPFERRPIETFVLEYDSVVIAQAISRELSRGGQVYYLYNRVETIDLCAAKLAQLAPEARIATAHGQMNEAQLSSVWQNLMNGEIDILVCTTIIETGVDVRNCNTLIIEDADRMGLSQLYQIRGRVGRSARKAYAYFTFKPMKVLTDIAAKRLSAIREYTSFGSGFRIAMRDLQIRGAGNILGHSQHGHMDAVGYDLYVKMLNNAIAAQNGEVVAMDKSDCLLDVRMDAYIPDGYIPDAASRIEVYKRIAGIENLADANDVLDEIDDRYGEPPKTVKALIDVSLVRVEAAELDIYEISQRGDCLIIYSDAVSQNVAAPIVHRLGQRAIFMPGKKPYLSVRLGKSETPLEALRLVMTTIKELRELIFNN